MIFRSRLRRLLGLVRSTQGDCELADEINSHFQSHIEDNIRSGMTPDEARRDALLKFGGVDVTVERHRDLRGVPFIDHLVQDLRYGFRALRKSPGFSVAAIATLGLGIGVNTAMFSFSDATAFRPPDVPRPGEVVRIFGVTKAIPYGRLSYPDYVDYRDNTTTLAGVAAYDAGLVAMSRHHDDIPELLGVWFVSGNFFSTLEVVPEPGRAFRDEEDRQGAGPTVVISHGLWERRFQSDPAVVGSEVMLGTRPFTIIGVAPGNFAGTELYFHPDLYVPIAMAREVESTIEEDFLSNRADRWLNVLGRLKPDANPSAASAEMATIARSLEHAYPASNRDNTAIAIPEVTARGKLDDGGYEGAALALGTVALVLLIACANVANLLLSRATSRRREIAVRLAVGASRGRLVQQLLTESLILASAGGLLGLAIGYIGVRYMSRMLAESFALSDMPIYMDQRIDRRVLLFTLAISITTSVLFGLVPALRSTRVDLIPTLKGSGQTQRRARWLNFQNVLVASQVALSVVVLTVAGLSIRGFIDKLRTDPGFKTDHVLLMSFNPALVHYSQNQTQEFYQQLVEQTKQVPGVAAVGLTQFVPLGFNGGPVSLVIDGYQMPQGQDRVSIPSNVVDTGYWATMRTTIVRGRAFDEHDTISSPGVAIVNETMARTYWPNQEAIGKVLHLRESTGPAVQVVGIAKDGKYGYLAEPQQPYVFMPFSQHFRPMMVMTVLAEGDAAKLAAPIRAKVETFGASVPLFDVRTLDNLYQFRALMQPRLAWQTMTTLGVLGMVLAVVGLYSVIAYLTGMRTREIGIRMAIGADRRRVLGLVLHQAIPMAAPGLLVGIVLAFLVTPFFAVPFDFVPHDSVVAVSVPVLLGLAATAAALIPGHRAARVNPTVALRDE